jgi:Glycosyl hydrolase family 65, N-terminal domain.
MKLKVLLIYSCFLTLIITAQDINKEAWQIEAKNIDANNYYGITVANGMVGMVSSAAPLKVDEVILNGVYDYYQRGRVSNILKTFSHMNMHLEVNGQRATKANISNFKQTLNMKVAKLITTFNVGNKVSVKQELMSLRNLPYTAMAIVEITAKEAVDITPINYITAPNHLQDVRNTYAEIDRPHVLIPLMSSLAFSPGKKKVATSTSFIFQKNMVQSLILYMKIGIITCI